MGQEHELNINLWYENEKVMEEEEGKFIKKERLEQSHYWEEL